MPPDRLYDVGPGRSFKRTVADFSSDDVRQGAAKNRPSPLNG
jgi:hypothetical protein